MRVPIKLFYGQFIFFFFISQFFFLTFKRSQVHSEEITIKDNECEYKPNFLSEHLHVEDNLGR
jgi:hypothetical protein